MGLLQNLVSLTALLSTAGAVVPAISGYTLTWSDDFTGGTNAPPSSSNWITDTGTSYPGGPAAWGTGEVQTYTSSVANLRQTGRGFLEIVAQKSSAGQWTSGRIETQRKDFMAKAGGAMRIQAKLALPSVKQPAGYWPAFWALGAAYRGNYTNWPFVGEFDIMESVNGVNKAYATLHCDTNPGGSCNEPNGLGSNLACSGTACQGNFHIYTLEVDRTSSTEALRWYLDGTQFWQVTQSQVPSSVWNRVVHNPVFILLDLAMGGSFPNGVYGSSTPLSTTTSGGVFTVDYVAVYNK
ncbi:putative Family 16 glycosyl hydrolase [Seiridium cardinale]|uniref:Family 16 glycosyl hydrolase n=1 Tax=Seiridium cardinale TaxID=138064 RepID=A0ABR2XT02_9PEZI